MDQETLKLTLGAFLAIALVFYVFGKSHMSELGDDLINLQKRVGVEHENYLRTQKKFRFWNRTPSLIMLVAALVNFLFYAPLVTG